MNVLKKAGLLVSLLSTGFGLTASADSFLINTGSDVAPYEFLSSLNRGAYSTLYTFDGDGHGFETYIQFNIPSDLLPEGHIVTSASFLVYYAFGYSAYGDTSQDPGTLTAYQISEDWQESTMTWSNRPNATLLIDEITDISSFGTQIFDVTQTAQDWLSGSSENYGIALKSPTSRVFGFNSFEADVADTLKATLVINTEPLPEVPTLAHIGLAVLTMSVASVAVFQLQKEQTS